MAKSNHFKTHNSYLINGVQMECLKGCTLYGMAETIYSVGILEHSYEVYQDGCIFDTIVFDYYVVIRQMSASGLKVVHEVSRKLSSFANANEMFKEMLVGLN